MQVDPSQRLTITGAAPDGSRIVQLPSLDRKAPVGEPVAAALSAHAALETAFTRAIENRKNMALKYAVAATEAALGNGESPEAALQVGFEILHENLPKKLGPYNMSKAGEAWAGWGQKKEVGPREAMQWAVSSWEEFARIHPGKFSENVEHALNVVPRTWAKVAFELTGFTSLMEDPDSGMRQAIESFARSVGCPLDGSRMEPEKPRAAQESPTPAAIMGPQARARDEKEHGKPQVAQEDPIPAAVRRPLAAVEEAFGRAIAAHEEAALSAGKEAAEDARFAGREDFADVGFDILNANLLCPLQRGQLARARDDWRFEQGKPGSSAPKKLMERAPDALRKQSPDRAKVFALHIHHRLKHEWVHRLEQLAMGSGFYSVVMDPKTRLPQAIADLALAMGERLSDCAEYLPPEDKKAPLLDHPLGVMRPLGVMPSKKVMQAAVMQAPARNLDNLVEALLADREGDLNTAQPTELEKVFSQPGFKKLSKLLGPVLETARRHGKLDEEQRDELQASVMAAALDARATENQALSLMQLGPRAADALIAGNGEQLKESLAEMLKLLGPSG
jgi:hypothetical protein